MGKQQRSGDSHICATNRHISRSWRWFGDSHITGNSEVEFGVEEVYVLVSEMVWVMANDLYDQFLGPIFLLKRKFENEIDVRDDFYWAHRTILETGGVFKSLE